MKTSILMATFASQFLLLSSLLSFSAFAGTVTPYGGDNCGIGAISGPNPISGFVISEAFSFDYIYNHKVSPDVGTEWNLIDNENKQLVAARFLADSQSDLAQMTQEEKTSFIQNPVGPSDEMYRSYSHNAGLKVTLGSVIYGGKGTSKKTIIISDINDPSIKTEIDLNCAPRF